MSTRELQLALDLTDMAWADRALCPEVDPEIFHPMKGEPSAPAKRVCMACEVRAECLDYALRTNQMHGVWGGTSERQRRYLRAKRNQDAA